MSEIKPSARFGPPVEVRELFSKERRALLELLESLGPPGWEAPTACPGWSVHDVATHILGDDLGRLARTRDGQGVAPDEGEALSQFVDRINDEWVTAARRLSGRLVIDLLRHTGPQIAAMWRSLDAAAPSEPVSWAGPEPAPVWLDAARDYTEYWVHQQQIREAVGADRLTSPEFMAPVVEAFMRALPYTLRDASARTGTAVQVSVSGASGGTWAVRRHEAGWSFADPLHDRADTQVSLDADTFWRLCTRAIEPDEARSLAVVAGDDALARRVLTIVSIIRSE